MSLRRIVSVEEVKKRKKKVEKCTQRFVQADQDSSHRMGPTVTFSESEQKKSTV